MTDFALVTEGPTDQAILRNILTGYFQDQREPVVHREQPPSPASHGGWTLVFQYLRDKKFRQAFQFHRFLILQVDADVCEEPGFGVPRQDESGPLPVEILVGRIVGRLKLEIGREDLEIYQGRFIFAIAVNQAECWVLPLWFKDARARKETGCLGTLGNCEGLRQELDQKNFPWISEARKDVRSYDHASRQYRKRKKLEEARGMNPSLEIFLQSFDAMSIGLTHEV